MRLPIGFALTLIAMPSLAADIDAGIAGERAALAAGYLAFAGAPQGGFFYEYDFPSGLFTTDDNIVRQAGAGSALGEYLAGSGDLEHAGRMEEVLGFYESQSLAYEGGLIISDTGDPNDGNTGATGLALLSELFYFEATGDESFAALRAGWLTALAALQRPDGGFARAPVGLGESPYYNGEAWLALAHAARLFPEDEAIERMVVAADGYMITRYQSDPETGFVHWGLQSAAIRYAETGAPHFAHFLTTVSEAFITEMRPSIAENSNSCSLVEGIAAAALALDARDTAPDLVALLMERSTAEMAKNIELQIVTDQTRFDLADTRFYQDAAMPLFAGAFLNGRHVLKTRIDYTQHCLSALLKYEALLEQRLD